jgi:hypothetical protein
MTSNLKLDISRIWTESWTSFAELDSTTNLYGDLEIRIDETLMPGVHVEVEGGAELNTAARELIGFRDFPDGDSYSMEFSVMPKVEYTIERKGDSLIFTPERGRRVGGKRQLEVSYSQALSEVASFRTKLRELLLANCSKEASIAWWRMTLHDNLEDP